MAIAADTGNGATITLGTTGAIGSVVAIRTRDRTLGKLDASHLGTTTYKEYLPDDLAEPGEMEVDVLFSTTIAELALGVVESATYTWPLRSGESVAAKVVGTAFIDRVKDPDLINGTIQIMTVKLSFDGDTGPAFTVAS